MPERVTYLNVEEYLMELSVEGSDTNGREG